MCSFCIDMDCAKLLPTLKLACHPHRLAYFRGTSELDCRTCGKHCGGGDCICRCVQCDISFHLKCVVPSKATSKYHRHPLILTESVKEYDSDEFCCDDCENEKDPKHPVYYCQSCIFVAHIPCVLPDVDEDQITSSMESEEALSEKEMEQNEGSNGIHALCNFKLGVKCSALTAHELGVSQEKRMDRVTELHHFSHQHKLVLGYSNDPIEETRCKICESSIFGPAYFCPESCLRLPQKIQVPFHLKHMLVFQQPEERSNPQCYACPLSIEKENFAYSCEDCQLDLHPICANYLKRPLKCESHLDDLYYFGKDYQLLRAKDNYIPWETHFACHKCENTCKEEPFYRCLQCSINFHLKCVPIPEVVQSKYHRHPLTLTDSFVEDDSGLYYCDFSEKERNPKDHVYYCKEVTDG
ncbi:uncharacterized protein LOC120128371 [Hibiscus syriacus]|uniref:uncharacterized protein LOC120128371 n=1 Tax=Hibiscus syriacus TaxID=106335 RepID=UPI001924791B|nr:uncharacterized protein LOC120128371 [Hibiscus syriacus]